MSGTGLEDVGAVFGCECFPDRIGGETVRFRKRRERHIGVYNTRISDPLIFRPSGWSRQAGKHTFIYKKYICIKQKIMEKDDYEFYSGLITFLLILVLIAVVLLHMNFVESVNALKEICQQAK